MLQKPSQKEEFEKAVHIVILKFSGMEYYFADQLSQDLNHLASF